MAVKAWNPYLESYLECIGQILPTHGEEHHGAMSRGVMHSYYVRDKCIKEYAFAIPNEEAYTTFFQDTFQIRATVLVYRHFSQ